MRINIPFKKLPIDERRESTSITKNITHLLCALQIHIFLADTLLIFLLTSLCIKKDKGISWSSSRRGSGVIGFLEQHVEGRSHLSPFAAVSFPDPRKVPIYCWVYRVFQSSDGKARALDFLHHNRTSLITRPGASRLLY